MKWDKIYKRFNEGRKRGQTEHSYKILLHHVNMFIGYLKEKDINLKSITKEKIEDYKTELLKVRDKSGLIPPSTWHGNHFRYVNIFLNWLKEADYIRKNPLPRASDKKIAKEMEKRLNQRRISLMEKKNIPQDQKLIEIYIIHYKQYVHFKRSVRLNQKALSTLLNFVREKEKRLIDLKSEDITLLKEKLCQLEAVPSRKFSVQFVKYYLSRIKVFYTWLYQEGYIAFDFSNELDESSIQSVFKRIRAVKKEDQRERYYSVKEILRAYKIYLNKTISSYVVSSSYYLDLLFYIRFLVTKRKTLYTADKKEIEAFKNYLRDFEYLPAKRYKPDFQVKRMRHIKRFYDWFTVKNYIVNNPFKDYSALEHEKQIIKYYEENHRNFLIDIIIPEEFSSLYEGILAFEKNIGFAQGTLDNHKKGWEFFFQYLGMIGVSKIEDVDELVLNDFQIYLHQCKNAEGKILSINTRCRHLIAVKRLYQYLRKFKLLEHDPSGAITYPKNQSGLSTAGMTDREVRDFLDLPDENTDIGIRDRAILELLYSSGVRSNELCHLKIDNIDFKTGMLKVDKPKGGRSFERIIPVGKMAIYWIEQYINKVRKKYVKKQSEYLFLNRKGEHYCNSTIWFIVKNYQRKSALKNRRIVTHSFRVSCATEMLKKGANIKIVKDQLGHNSIQSTEKYLRLVPQDLKKAHRKYHPRDKKFIESLQLKPTENQLLLF